MTDAILTVEVPGRAKTQGSMQLSRDPRTGREFARYSDQTVNHRNFVIGILGDSWRGQDPLDGAVAVRCTFYFQRPKSHFGTGRNSALLKESAPAWMASIPDVDKALRLVLDALVIAGVLDDDALVAEVHGAKVWADRSSTLIELFAL